VARDVGRIPELLGPGLTEVELVERWDDLADLA